MPKLHPPHDQHWPHDPSPLGLFWYTAADVEREVEDEAMAAQAFAAASEGLGLAAANTSSDANLEEAGIEEEGSPRKRRRLNADDGEAAADSNSITRRLAVRSDDSDRQQDSEMAHVAPSRSEEASWSFRALERDDSEDLNVDNDDAPRAQRRPPDTQSDDGFAADASTTDDVTTPPPPVIDPAITSDYQLARDAATTRFSATSSPRAMADEDDASGHTSTSDVRVSPPDLSTRTTDSEGLGDVDGQDAQPESPDDIPARPTLSTEGVSRLSGLVKIGKTWS